MPCCRPKKSLTPPAERRGGRWTRTTTGSGPRPERLRSLCPLLSARRRGPPAGVSALGARAVAQQRLSRGGSQPEHVELTKISFLSESSTSGEGRFQGESENFSEPTTPEGEHSPGVTSSWTWLQCASQAGTRGACGTLGARLPCSSTHREAAVSETLTPGHALGGTRGVTRSSFFSRRSSGWQQQGRVRGHQAGRGPGTLQSHSCRLSRLLTGLHLLPRGGRYQNGLCA